MTAPTYPPCRFPGLAVFSAQRDFNHRANGAITRKRVIAVGVALIFAGLTASASSSEYYVAMAITFPNAPFHDRWYSGKGWSPDSVYDARQNAIAACQRSSGRQCSTGFIGSTSMLGGCVALVQGTRTIESPHSTERDSELFGGASQFGRDSATDGALSSCSGWVHAGIGGVGYEEEVVTAWRCQPMNSICSSDIVSN